MRKVLEIPLDTDAVARFWQYTNKDTLHECWEWTGTLSNGYGRLKIKGKLYLAHRISWTLHFGPILNNLLICHTCDNPKCVNPKHLFMGTYKDNHNDMFRKGRGFNLGEWTKNHPEVWQVGELSSTASTTNKQAEKIRSLHKTGTFTQVSLAKIFKLSTFTIYRIVNNLAYCYEMSGDS